MLHLCVKAEAAKLKHSVIWLACILLPLIPAFMGTFNYLQCLDILTEGWYSLWTQYTLFYAIFFYAPLIGLYASYLWRLEHLDHNWNVLMTMPVAVSNIFMGKLLCIFKITLITQIWMFILFLAGGKIAGLPGLPPFTLFLWACRGTLAAFTIGTLQLLLSMCIRSFAIPIGIALAGSVAGLLITSRGSGLFWPYALMLTGMNSNKSMDALGGMETVKFVCCVFLFFLLFLGIAIRYLKSRDVAA